MKIFVDLHCPASKPSSGTITLCSPALGLLVHERCRKVAAVSFLVTTITVLNCWWFLFLPHQQPDLLIRSASTSNHSSTTMHSSENTIINRTDSSAAPAGAAAGNYCDLSRGQWIPDSRPPLYTNDTCKYIQDNQNCMLNGRPDRGYLNWQWKPHECELPPFDSKLFLELMRGKKMAFIGDSIARNHMQALLCALAQAEDPENLFNDGKDKEFRWGFPSYNFTLTNLWSPFLVNHTEERGVYRIHLDMADEMWSSRLADYDMAIISTGYWYFRPSVYYVDSRILGTNPHSGVNLTTFELLPALRIAWGTVLKHMVNEYRGIPILRTVTVPHFERGSWSNGGACNKTQPVSDPHMELPLDWMSQEMNKIQIEEFMKAAAPLNKPGLLMSRLQLLNITYSSFLRPDGHPGPYRIQQPNEPRNDCLHWCLPGPIDMWNQLLLQTLERFVDQLTNMI